jgi:hypothetical protein
MSQIAKKLPYTWIFGSDRHTHAGFAVYSVEKRDHVSGLFDDATKAVEAAERLGEGYAAVRVVKTSRSETYASGRISREDLPVLVDL